MLEYVDYEGWQLPVENEDFRMSIGELGILRPGGKVSFYVAIRSSEPGQPFTLYLDSDGVEINLKPIEEISVEPIEDVENP